MSDPKEPNHWELLASQLGATPPPQEEKTPQGGVAEERKASEESTAAPSSRKKPGDVDKPSRPPRPPTDWSRVATELGMEFREPVLPISEHVSEREVRAVGPGDAAETPVEGTKMPPKAAPAPEKAGTRLWGPDAGAADSVLGSAEVEFDSPEASAASTEAVVESTRTDLVPMGTEAKLHGIPEELVEALREPADKTSGRKRRKRRQKPKKAVVEGSADEAAEAVAEEPSISGKPGDFAVADAATAEQESKDRAKRRRRRRGPGRKKGTARKEDGSAESGDAEELAVASEESEGPDEAGPEAARRKADESEAKSGDRKEAKAASKLARSGHRGIPTWQEAIGIVIAANMEGRSKTPSSTSSSRSRGGRRRPGRDKSGEKGT
jgi:hypothetical protein